MMMFCHLPLSGGGAAAGYMGALFHSTVGHAVEKSSTQDAVFSSAFHNRAAEVASRRMIYLAA